MKKIVLIALGCVGLIVGGVGLARYNDVQRESAEFHYGTGPSTSVVKVSHYSSKDRNFPSKISYQAFGRTGKERELIDNARDKFEIQTQLAYGLMAIGGIVFVGSLVLLAVNLRKANKAGSQPSDSIISATTP